MGLKGEIQGDLIRSLGADWGFIAQEGWLNLSRVGTDEDFDCTKTDCYFSNPNSAYSFSSLPLSPQEDRDKNVGDLYDLPQWSKTSFDGSNIWKSGISTSWQLRHDEVVLLFGCTPPPRSSRYFGVTPYVHGIYSENQRKWIAVSGSLGDTKGVVRAGDSLFGHQNRLRTSARQPNNVDLTSDGAGSESAFNKITLVLMGASRSSVGRAKETAEHVLSRHGVSGAVNVLGIPQGFGEVGLADEATSHYSYFSLLVRNILDGTAVSQYEDYASKSPLLVWRLTPKDAIIPNMLDLFCEPEIVPRLPPNRDPPSEAFLLDALEFLISRVEATFSKSHVVAHSLISQSIWDSIGVDYGKQCIEKESPVCSYDNRDVIFLSVVPFVHLNTWEKFTYVVGVNHHVAGTTLYNSVAVNQWNNQIGVAAADDAAMFGSAEQFLQGTEFEHIHKYLYALRLARECWSVPFCYTIPTEGAKSVSLEEPALVLERLYVSPGTGVGPVDEDVLMPHTMTFTPRSKSTEEDSVSRVNAHIRANSACLQSVFEIATCLNGISSVCCNGVAQFGSGNCFCTQLGVTVAEALQTDLGKIRLLSILCNVQAPQCDQSV